MIIEHEKVHWGRRDSSQLSGKTVCVFPSSVPTLWPCTYDFGRPGPHRKLNQSHECRNAFLLKRHLTSFIKRSAASGFDPSYVIRGSGLENTWNRQSANPSPGMTLDLAYGLKWDCPYHGDRCWELHGKGRGLCQEGKSLPLLFDSTGRQEIQGSLSIFLSSSCSIPQING